MKIDLPLKQIYIFLILVCTETTKSPNRHGIHLDTKRKFDLHQPIKPTKKKPILFCWHRNRRIMIYQFNDPAKSSDLETEPTSTIYCNNAASLMQTAGGSGPIDLRKNSNYSSTSRSGGGAYDNHRKVDSLDRSGAEVIGNRGRRMSAGGSHGHCRSRRTYDNSDTSSSKSTISTYGSTCTDSSCSGSDSSSSSGEPNLPYPGFPEISLKYLRQDTRPRNWCLLLITNPWFERISILVILFNCITLGMYQPCVDDECVTNRCKILQVMWFAILVIEMNKKNPLLVLIRPPSMSIPRYILLPPLSSSSNFSFSDIRRHNICILLVRNEYKDGGDGRLR